jgi:DNA polymerase V
MGNIKIIKGVFDTKLELEHAEVAAGFPILTDDYSHETLDFNSDYIKHPEASFYGDVEGDDRRWHFRRRPRYYRQGRSAT